MTRQCSFMLLGTLALLGAAAGTHANQGLDAGEERRPASTAKGELVHRVVETTPEIRQEGATASGNDCNDNGIDDVCDIDCDAEGGDCNVEGCGQGADCNENGFLDECEVAIRNDYSFLVDPPEPILDGVTIRRTFNVPEGGSVIDVDLGLTLTHEFLGDLIITLTHAGTSVDVYHYGPCQACESTCGFDGTVFDDEANEELPCIDHNEGIYLPVEALSAFDGMDSEGDWTLEIYDGFIGYEGSLAGWSLSSESTLNDCNLNAIPDDCDVVDGTSDDGNENGIPDECEPGACCGEESTCEVTMRDECFGIASCTRDPEWVCDGDVDGDGQVNPADAGRVQAAFGSNDEQDLCSYDVDCDGQINPVDLGIVQSLFGTCAVPRGACPDPPLWFVGDDCKSVECP